MLRWILQPVTTTDKDAGEKGLSLWEMYPAERVL